MKLGGYFLLILAVGVGINLCSLVVLHGIPRSGEGSNNATVAVDVPLETGKKVAANDNSQSHQVIDVLSTGSVSRPHYLQAQQDTWGQHENIRNFITLTEHNDTEQECHQTLTMDDALQIAKRCLDGKRQQYKLLSEITDLYITEAALKQKSEKGAVGWICAQKRPISGFWKYMKELQQYSSLPDYLLITDDDTYVNVDAVLAEVERYNTVTSITAGCLLKSKAVNFTLPLGGFGTILNKQALERFVKQISCANNPTDDLSRTVCANLQENIIGEQSLFKDGMSILELMYTYAHDQPFTKHRDWNDAGFCLASDTTLGYFVNRYVLPTQSQSFQNDHNHMIAYQGSTMKLGFPPKHAWSKENRRQCYNQHYRDCKAMPEKQAPGHICHYIDDQQMRLLYERDGKQEKR